MRSLRVIRTLVYAAFLSGIALTFVESSETPKEAPAKEQDGKTKEGDAASAAAAPTTDPFCDAIIDPAREQRYLLKQDELKLLLKHVNERVLELEKQKAEYEGWVKRREDFAKLASKNLVEIYATMKPEASAARMSELSPELAASLLLAIAPRQASSILNEMDEKVAATLTGIMAASARKKDPS